MPSIYLSPSVQQFNQFVNGGTEEQYMNLIADAMEPYLRSTGIGFTRNDPDESLTQAINNSNAGNYDLHFAIHSNAAPAQNAGQVRGTDVYYYTPSSEGRRAATVIADNYKEIYPDPSRVKTVGSTTLAELRRTNAPAILIETAYHDNLQDAQWIKDNINGIARNLVQGLAEYFSIPFIEATVPQTGIVATSAGAINVRSRPNMMAAIIGSIPNGTTVTINGRFDDWYVVNYNGLIGYAYAPLIQV